MKDLPTTDLLEVLSEGLDNDSLQTFLEDLGNSPAKNLYFSEHMATANITAKDIVRNCSGYISKSYVYEIINGVKTNPSREVLLVLCLACHMDAKSTRRALSIYELPNLYPKNPRDAVILTCINTEKFDISQVNDTLASYELDILPNLK